MKNQFYKLPVEIARRKDLQSSDKIVFTMILDHQGGNVKARPGIQTLMMEAGLSRQTVCDSIRRLEAAGFLSVERRGNGRSNFYQSSLHPRPVGNNQTSLETRPVQKLDQSRIQTTASLETRPEPVQKLDPNQRDQLNQTKREEVAYSAGAFEDYWNGKSNHYKSDKETLPVKELNRSKNLNTGVKETLPEALKKLEPNQTDQLNQTKEPARGKSQPVRLPNEWQTRQEANRQVRTLNRK